MKTSHAIVDFLNSKSISSEVLDIQITKRINTYLADYWQGTTGKINWSKINNETKKVVLSQDITDIYLISITDEFKFKALSSSELILYHSGLDCCLLVERSFYEKNLFDFMNDFCYLDSILLFSKKDFSLQKELNFIEVRILDYICGQI